MPLPTDQVCSRQGSATRATRRAMVPAAWTTAVALTCGGALIAQQVPPPTAPPETAAVAQTDPSSPRAALDGYLDAARREEWEDAARWLDLASVPRRRGAQLAERLDAVLARHVLIDLDAVSGAAVGDTLDDVDPRIELVGTIPMPGGTRDTVRLVRGRVARGATTWRFSAGTVARIDTWYDRLPNPWVRERLPEPLLRDGPMGVQWWQWIAIGLIAPVAALVAWLVARPLGAFARRVAARTDSGLDDRIVDRLAGPVRLGLGALLAAPLVRLLGLPLGVEGALLAIARATGLLALFWALLRGTRLLERTLEKRTWGSTPQGRSLVPLLGRVLRVVLFAIGLLVALAQLGYPVGTVLAGLGIGGIAVALAAQKTIENLFGSLSLAADRSFRIGDWVAVDGISGTVEQIGLRSTAIRTLGRTVVRIPNGKLADMRIENHGLRDRFVLDTTLRLSRDTTLEQLRAVTAQWEHAVRTHPHVIADGITVRLVALGEGSFDVLVQAWFATADIALFRTWQEELLRGFHAAAEREGARFAVPVRTVQLGGATTAGPRDGDAPVPSAARHADAQSWIGGAKS